MNIDSSPSTISYGTSDTTSGAYTTNTVNIDGLFPTTTGTRPTGIRGLIGAMFQNNTSTALFTLLVLIVIILGAGGKVFGGYGNYPGYGGYSIFGYTFPSWRRGYRYDPYNIYED